MAWKVENGKSINLLLSHWVQGHPPSLKQSEGTHMPSFSDFVREDGLWNPCSIFRVFNNSTAKDILAMEPPIFQNDDYLYWKYTEDGCYNIRSGYSYLLSKHSSAIPHIPSFPWKLVWLFPFSSKFPLFIWKLAHHIIPTKTVLAHRGFRLDTLCPLCRADMETPEHLFRSCDVIQHIWRSSLLGIHSLANPNVSFVRWLADHISYLHRASSTGFNSLLHFYAILRSIWLTRNSIVFENFEFVPVRILHLAGALHHSHLQLPSLRYEGILNRVLGITAGNQLSTLQSSLSYRLYICRNSLQNGYTTMVESDSRVAEFSYMRASSLFAAYSQALLQVMLRQETATYPAITFVVSSRNLCSVLASQKSVPIAVRNSLHAIRTLLRLHRSWSVSLATG